MFELDRSDGMNVKFDGWKITIVAADEGHTFELTGLEAGQIIYELFSETVSAKPTADLCGSTEQTRCGSKCDC